MYRLLLVDDEVEIAEYFYNLLSDCAQLALELYVAHSSQEALDCMDSIRIDIVLSDIKMPKMNGLQMYGIIKQRWPLCRVIFLSGVMDFDYVYSSIQERQVRYLTKLEPVEKILGTVREVIDEIENDYLQSLSVQRVQHQLEQALPLLQEQYLHSLLSGLEATPQEAARQFEALEIPLDAAQPFWMVGGVFDRLPENIQTLEFQRQAIELRSIADSYMGTVYNLCCYMLQQCFVWLLQPTDSAAQSHEQSSLLAGQLEYIQAACASTLGLHTSFTYIDHPITLQELRDGFVRIKAALGGKRSLAQSSVIFCCDEPALPSLLTDSDELADSRRLLVDMNMLESYLELGQQELFFPLFSRIIDSLLLVKTRNGGSALEIYYSVATMLMRTINTYRLTEQLAFRLGLYKLLRLDEHESWPDAVDYLYQVARSIFAVRFDNADRSASDAVLFVQKYIGDNLSGDLTLVTLADLAHLNPSYLSRLFKERTCKNLYDYILQMRMGKAQELLSGTTERIQDIAAAVGYSSAQSFTRVFHRMTGRTPTEHRDLLE